MTRIRGQIGRKSKIGPNHRNETSQTHEGTMSKHPPITPDRFDQMIKRPELLWGLSEIAKATNVSEQTVRRWHRQGLAPITKPDGKRFFAFRSEITEWLKGN